MAKWVSIAMLIMLVPFISGLPKRIMDVTSTGSPTPCNYDCTNKPDGDYPDPTSSCTAHYYVCANHYCFNFYCYPPLVYNPANDECVYEQDLPACSATTPYYS